MIVKYVVKKFPDGYISISMFEYNPWLKEFRQFASIGDKSDIEWMLNDQELKYYERWKKSKSKRDYFYGIEAHFPNPAYQHILGVA